VSEASYLPLMKTGELEDRAAQLKARLESCSLCPRGCGVRRLAGEKGFCRTGRTARVASWCLHRGEEPPISGHRGSGTVFFAHCNLACIFCQNHQISQEWPEDAGRRSAEDLARIFLELQEGGAHNINWVSPGHVAAQAVEALTIAAAHGLRVPVVYNSNGYDDVETLRNLEGIVDVYMPDLKYADERAGAELSRVEDYGVTARAALREMWRQVGPLRTDDRGVALKGLLVRHLVLPDDLSGTGEVLGFLAEELGRDVSVSLMSQYYPSHEARADARIGRRLRPGEYDRALRLMEREGLENGYIQGMTSPAAYRPDFEKGGHPFETE